MNAPCIGNFAGDFSKLFSQNRLATLARYVIIRMKGGDIMYRIREVAQILGFTERAVRQWVMDGKIKAVKIMSEWRIPEEEVERLKRGE